MSDPINPHETPHGDIRILIIDDDNTNSALAKGLLERHGFQIQVASNPLRALENFSRDIDGVDLVLLDYFMPTLNGGQAVQHLRKLNPDIKIVLFSGAEEMNLRQIMKQHPIDAYIHKPLRIDEALSVIHQLVGEPSLRA